MALTNDPIVTINMKSYVAQGGLSFVEYVYLQLIYDGNHAWAEELRQDSIIRTAKLQLEGYIKITGDSFEDIELREKGIKLFQDDKLTIDQLATQYRDLFPAGIKTGGYPVRSSLADIEGKLKKFKKKYKFSSDIILEATKKYVERLARQNYTYMKTASYFILKDGESQLAAECETINEEYEYTSNSTMI